MPTTISDTPTVLVVFGATGDLMERKIAPALYHLHEKRRLPERFRVVGFARREIPDDEFRDSLCTTVRAHHGTPVDEDDVHAWAGAFSYSRGEFDDTEAYGRLVDDLNAIDDAWQCCANKLFYLAVPPQFYRTIFEHLAASGLTATCGEGATGGWTRIIVEKPFGKDTATARELDELLGTLFEEHQIYRIDHYLAKEMLQGIMSFRFSNNLLEPSWDNRAIDRIEIDLLETLGAESRGAFYDGVGALRDVGQNHLLQMLALITMAQPSSMDADSIRAQRVAALRSLAPMSPDDVRRATFRAQYDGYRAIPGVAPDSQTETFFKVVTQLDSPDWRGVPVVMQGGKRLATVRKKIVTSFRHPAPCLCDGLDNVENRVEFQLEPVESISIAFWTKKPGFESRLEERDFNFFLYEKEEKTQYVEEYAKLLLDAVNGDQTLFVSTREVRAMWEFIDPIVDGWNDGLVALERYAPDTDEVVTQAAHVGRILPHADPLRREIGVVGLGKMGAGLARNLMEHGWRTVGYNRTAGVTMTMEPDGLVASYALAELVDALEAPRVVWLMVPAGAPVDEVLFGSGGLAELLEAGDTVIDGGNSLYKDAASRAARLAEHGIAFVDVGTSGGPAGARRGACLMIGGSREEFARLRPLYADISIEGGFRHFEGAGAGHFVKMVHNGIEYGMMQAIAEGLTILRGSDYHLDLTDVTAIYNRGSVIESRLVGWLEGAFRLHGEDLEGVSGSVGHTGEGAWTIAAAREQGIHARVIEDALRFRIESERDPDWTGRVLSALREQFGQHPVRE
ncbi:MAG: glucose-6-phosphate dehydrogenase [Coriobacteriia bacterium]|nr:glucose-6-phosphate dehydrogenase [Coriobacteriia bacterium]